MVSLEERLRGILIEGLGGEADLETLPNGHVCGHVISPQFEGLDYENRRKKIRELLDAKQEAGDLSKEDRLNVSTLLTYTPAEWSVATTDTP